MPVLDVFCFARVSVSLPSGASSVMVEPLRCGARADAYGATNMLPDPTKRRRRMTVRPLVHAVVVAVMEIVVVRHVIDRVTFSSVLTLP